VKNARGTVVQVDMRALWQACVIRFADPDYPTDAKHVAAALGFNPSVFTGIKKAARGIIHREITGNVLVSICHWLGRNPMDFTTPPFTTPPFTTSPTSEETSR
jgi:hypothetical protein